mgnify:CR=1 FL=1
MFSFPELKRGVMVVFFICLFFWAAFAHAGMIWKIGKADNSYAEFALAPGNYANYSADPVYVVGESTPESHWPYVHPGPEDAWAGGRSHMFRVVFGLRDAPAAAAVLHIDLVDTHGANPPKIRVSVNGSESEFALPAGGSADTVSNAPQLGKEHKLDIPVPASVLKKGNNEVCITTVAGSWLLYDWIGLKTRGTVKMSAIEQAIILGDAESTPLCVESKGRLFQVVRQSVSVFGSDVTVQLAAEGGEPVEQTLAPGVHKVELLVPRVETEAGIKVEARIAGDVVGTTLAHVKPVRLWQVYLLPHSHVDIGYTHVQSEVEQKQCDYFDTAMELAGKTNHHPKGVRFRWNSEVMWAVDSYMRKASPEKRAAFVDAVKKGWIGLDALYGNELTALCRPEELVELTGYARRMRETYGVPIEAAMISDVPGYTWGIVPVLAQSGIKYFSIGPNMGHRIGFTLSAWSDRPFYWVSPSGQEKVLCWVTGMAYSGFHGGGLGDGSRVLAQLARLEGAGYPYDMAWFRYNIGGDNGPPDPRVADIVNDWNKRYAYPKLILATTREFFEAFEGAHGDRLPSVSGDFTPYWEDGAASSAVETVLNRAAADRIVQAAALFAMRAPREYVPEDFQEAWRNVILYDEHTWGAHNSITEPLCDFVKQQWAVKQAFALDADKQSRALLDAALKPEGAGAWLVYNTSSWPRTGLVTLSREQSTAGDRVIGPGGAPAPSQRLTTGELAFLAKDVPPFGAKKYRIVAGEAFHDETAEAAENSLRTASLTLAVDDKTGAIRSLVCAGIEGDLVDTEKLGGLNDYVYVAGRDPKAGGARKRVEAATVTVKEKGPLVASLTIESAAPGCDILMREVRVIAGLDRVDIVNTLKKQDIYTPEAVHFAFPFRVPNPVVRMDTPWAVVRPEADQTAGACKNYFTVQRWVDVSNQKGGVTWTMPDTPLIEIGDITCDPTKVGWMERIEPSATLYAYVMNNYWETNYKASQGGSAAFRYALRPHTGFNAAQAARWGVEDAQPLLVAPADTSGPDVLPSLLTVEPSGVQVSLLKPADGGKDLIVRLYGASGRPEEARLHWHGAKNHKMWLSNLDEKKLDPLDGAVSVPPHGMVTVCCGWPGK